MRAATRRLWRDLWTLRGQVTAAALVVACGVASFVSLRATYESLLSARESYYRAYRFADVFAQLERAPAGLARSIESIPGVASVRTRVVAQVVLDVAGLEEPATGRLVSIPDRRAASGGPIVNDLSVRAGRYVEPDRDDEVIASEAFTAANGLEAGDTIGAVINGRWKRLRIVGVGLSPEYIYEVGGGTLFPDNRHFGVLWMGESALASAQNMAGAFNDVALTLEAGASEASVIERVDRLLARYGGLGAYGRADQVSHRFIDDEIAQNRISSTFVPGIFLGVAIFLLHLVLSRLISMQRTEIGLVKAFGYTDREVGLHYFRLALLTVGAGLAIGLGVALAGASWLTGLYREFYRFPELAVVLSPRVLWLTLLLGFATAAVAAFGPVRAAVRLPPAVAMRPEPPASVHAGLMDRLGMMRRLPSSARMILRSIARRGWKSGLSMAAIACAVGILVVGRWGLDAIRHMMRVQFELVQRDDATLVFAQPESAGIEHELRRLPGVIAVEPFRAVPAKLRFEHRSKRIDVTGLRPGSRLRRLIDDRLRPFPLPADGVVLTRKLGDVLGIAAGDRLTVEVLEGARPILTVPVAGLVDEPVGVGAYMDLGALCRLMREEGTLSGAWLAVEPSRAVELNRELKRMPAIAGVAFRDAVLRSFDDILNRSMRQVTWLEVIFAGVIAFGVVYNGARIALSERSNELASLRVLGFTRREVTWLLLGEQGILTVAAMPLGFAFGAALAWVLARRLDTELYRIPLVFESVTFSFSALVILAAALLSGMLVARRIDRLDLVAVLKTRE